MPRELGRGDIVRDAGRLRALLASASSANIIENVWSATTTDTTTTPLTIVSGPVLAIPEPGALSVWFQLIAKRVGANDYHTKSFTIGYVMQSGVAALTIHGTSQGGSGLSIATTAPIPAADGIVTIAVQSLVAVSVEYRAYTKAIVLSGS